MKIKAIERLLFKMRGMSVPVIRVSDIDINGRIGTIQFLGDLKDRPNSIISTWDAKGWEKCPEVMPVNIISEKGERSIGYVVSEAGNTVSVTDDAEKSEFKPEIKTTDLHVQYPNRERVIGMGAQLDDIPEVMELGRSMRNILIGIMIAAPLWWIVFKIIGLAR